MYTAGKNRKTSKTLCSYNKIWKWLFTDTVSAYKTYARDTVSAYKTYTRDTVSAYKIYARDTVSASTPKIHFKYSKLIS